VLYQVLAGLDPSLKAKFSLSQAEEYHYLNRGNCFTIDGVDEVEDFEATLKAMHALQFEPQRIESIWQLLAGILHLGQLKPRASAAKSDITEIANRDVLELTTRILGLPSADVLSSALCYRSVTIRGSLSMIPLSVSEVETNRDALSKTIYTRLFDHLVEKMNYVLFKDGDKTPMGQKTDQQKKAGRSIGILDVSTEIQEGLMLWYWLSRSYLRAALPCFACGQIFGFEIFDCNLFEQFCINYANESLQSHFNTHMSVRHMRRVFGQGQNRR
jgi:myosin-5